ncbi:methyltransferase domain-containing protein [Cohnella pontilimi]|uniref:Methyltransferase domain-containing protein n=1 Tax=Cohnella pontilimi TaxID=2564100 RepID=A0A4U0FG36_9BACL|nr:class I SAM-dependent methyltransferase [Cohnella pontilimi]TJY42332.1 methyltransferase domain-containing protein [Cohnella pontilimi]
MVDLQAIKQRQQQTWASGDYTIVATQLNIVSELLCEAAALRAGQKVLDVATGSGNTAIAAARRNCDVTGIDYVPELLNRARERAEAERIKVTLLEEDAENLSFQSNSFDVVLSTFGAMFAPNQEQTAKELARVCKPGGKIGMANWPKDTFIGQMLTAVSQLVPPPQGLKPVVLWGSEEHVRELFSDAISSLQLTRRTVMFRFLSTKHFLDTFLNYYGPTLKAYQSLDSSGKETMVRSLTDLINRYNQSGDESVMLPFEYAEIVATKR